VPAPQQAQTVIRLGYGRQTVEVSDFAVVNLGNAVALSKSSVVVADEAAEALTPGVRSGVVYVYDRALGETYCSPELHSAGVGGLLEITGSLAADVGVLKLTATSLPRHELALFLTSRTEGFVPHPGGSDGNLCLGSPVARLTASLADTGKTGALEYTLASPTIPLHPPDTIQPGESWSFQAWFRDRAAPGGSNFTDAVTVVFE